MSDNIFITEIKINELRHLKDITIPIVKDGGEMKHLILTGKNGSGKTSLLMRIGLLLDSIFTSNNQTVDKIHKGKTSKDFYYSFFEAYTESIDLKFNTNPSAIYTNFNEDTFIQVFFGASRNLTVKAPKTIEKIELPHQSSTIENYSNNFLRYLVFLRSKLTDASYRKDFNEVKKLEKWFSFFESTLKIIFNDGSITLEYDSSKLTFDILQKGKIKFGFNTLPDGYAAVLRILTELIMRMENKKTDAYDVNGVVLIDEIETHLHIELQKSILPFLTAFFPKVQFIVTTHSPFILNSIENAVVYDLENNLQFEDASELSYSSLIKNYFLVDSEYSHLLEKKIADFEILVNKASRTEAEDEKLADLLVDLKTLSPLLSPEMYIRFQQAQKRILKKTTAGN